MDALEFTIDGPPVSQQTRSPARLRRWKETVRAEALRRWPLCLLPMRDTLQIAVVYYHVGAVVSIDTDNLVKPIQDALIGLVYEDDRQIVDARVRKTDLGGSFRLRGLSPVLAEGFCRGGEFVYIRVERPPDHQELL